MNVRKKMKIFFMSNMIQLTQGTFYHRRGRCLRLLKRLSLMFTFEVILLVAREGKMMGVNFYNARAHCLEVPTHEILRCARIPTRKTDAIQARQYFSISIMYKYNSCMIFK